jgi:predicted metal-binding membrane protein
MAVHVYRIGVGLLAVTLAAWALLITRMRGMDDGPATDLGGLTGFLGIWVTMMAAMMLPSLTPTVLVFAQEYIRHTRNAAPTWVFVTGYLAAWTAYGLVAYGLFLLVRDWGASALEWHEDGRYLAGGAIAAAGLYQLTRAKDVCLRHCRTPMHVLAHSRRAGRLGALRLGVLHGAYCIGCCFGLFVVLFAVGVMSLFWMALIAGLIFVEKMLPFGERASRVVAVGLVLLGLVVAFDPSSVPGLTEPGSMT